MELRKVAMLTSGGLAPCLSSAVGGLIERYTEIDPSIEIICYKSGYMGLLLGDSITVTPEAREKAGLLHRFGGSPLGNSRIKLDNVKDCLKHGLVEEGQDPRKVAADQLKADGVDVLHTIGGDDTNTEAARLAAYLRDNGYELTVIGLPKTVDNDVVPIKQSLGAYTAAEQGARYFANVVSESSANPRMLIIHEVMGRHCGYLPAATAHAYRELLDSLDFAPGLGVSRAAREVHAVYIPEMPIDLDAESGRLREIMDAGDSVNVFVSEGAGVEAIVAEKKAKGEEVRKDAHEHYKLDDVDTGKWFGAQLKERLDAGKVLVQKSGYYSRSAPANAEDLRLIKGCVDLAVECALRGESGVIGHDEERGCRLRAIEFDRIAGGKEFDVSTPWFVEMLEAIGQPQPTPESGSQD